MEKGDKMNKKFEITMDGLPKYPKQILWKKGVKIEKSRKLIFSIADYNNSKKIFVWEEKTTMWKKGRYWDERTIKFHFIKYGKNGFEVWFKLKEDYYYEMEEIFKKILDINVRKRNKEHFLKVIKNLNLPVEVIR